MFPKSPSYRRLAPVALGAAALALAAPVLADQAAAPQLPGAVDTSRITAGTYAADPNHTLVNWRVNHFGFNDYIGLFGKVTGTLELDPASPENARLDVSVPITSVSVVAEGLKEHLLKPGEDGKAPDFFGPAPEPARFTSTNIRLTTANTAVVNGMLAMNGHSAPVTMLVNFTGAGSNPMSQAETIGFEGRAVIDRTQWGITTFAPYVGEEVELAISAAFEKQ